MLWGERSAKGDASADRYDGFRVMPDLPRANPSPATPAPVPTTPSKPAVRPAAKPAAPAAQARSGADTIKGKVGGAIESAFGLDPRLSRGQRLARFSGSSTLLSAAISTGIHLLLWAIAAIIYVGAGQAGGAGSGEGPGGVEVAVVSEQELAGDAAGGGAPLSLEAPAVPELSGSEASEVSLNDQASSGVEISGDIPGDIGELGAGLGAGDPMGDGLGLGGGGLGGGGAASFFGREAVGNRFAYVVDVSGSMGDLMSDPRGETVGTFTKLDTMKRELTKSVQALMEKAQFMVVLFSSGHKILGERRPEWVLANDAAKKLAKSDIMRIEAGGGTDPVSGLQQVFSMRPRPDAIYLMTDGNFDRGMGVADEVRALNADLRIPIHCITIGRAEEVDISRVVMERIATESGGTYAHVKGSLP